MFFFSKSKFQPSFIGSESGTKQGTAKSASYLRLNNIQGKTQAIVKFFIYHTVPKNPESIFPKLENIFFCTGNIKKLICL